MSAVTATITSAGAVMDPAWELLSIDVYKDVNRIPYAQIMLIDGDAARQKFIISDEAFFEPGKLVDITLRYEGDPAGEVSVFKGLVVRHAVEAGEQGMLLAVELRDAAMKMTRVRNSAVYNEKADSQIIEDLIAKHGLTKGEVAATQPAHKEIVQYACSDWDFMLSRADAYGMLVLADSGEISMAEIDLSGSPKHSFEFGISEIYNFEIEVDANNQYAAVQTIAWDLANQKLTQASKAADFALVQGNVNAASLARETGGDLQTLSAAVPQDPKELQARADAALSKSRMSMIRGRLSVPGVGDLQCLDLIEVAGVGKRFNGATIVTGIRHRVDLNGWQTDLQFGLSFDAFSARTDIMERPAGGQLPGVNGLQIGVVTNYDDPDKLSRVKVMLPGLGEQNGEVWARLASPDAGKDRGYVFRPEPGDEVIVGFFNDDPRQAVILGAMFSQVNTQPADLGGDGDKNSTKGIITRSGLTLGFVDADKPMVFIETPGKNKIVFDDDMKAVQISDQHGNSITMNEDGIEIKSAKDLKMEASGNVEIKGSKVDVK